MHAYRNNTEYYNSYEIEILEFQFYFRHCFSAILKANLKKKENLGHVINKSVCVRAHTHK